MDFLRDGKPDPQQVLLNKEADHGDLEETVRRLRKGVEWAAPLVWPDVVVRLSAPDDPSNPDTVIGRVTRYMDGLKWIKEKLGDDKKIEKTTRAGRRRNREWRYFERLLRESIYGKIRRRPRTEKNGPARIQQATLGRDVLKVVRTLKDVALEAAGLEFREGDKNAALNYVILSKLAEQYDKGQKHTRDRVKWLGDLPGN